MTTAESLKTHLQRIGAFAPVVKFALSQNLVEYLPRPLDIRAIVQSGHEMRIGVLMLFDEELQYFSAMEGFRKSPLYQQMPYKDIVAVEWKGGKLFGGITVTLPNYPRQYKDVFDHDKGFAFAERLRSLVDQFRRGSEKISVAQEHAVIARQSSAQELTRQGIEAARKGDNAVAQKLLQDAVRADPQNEQAWLWLSGVVLTDTQRRLCLETVLSINPNNTLALRGMEKLRAAGENRIEALPAVQPLTARQGEVQPAAGAFCSSCGKRVDADSRFCRFCGASLAARPQPQPAPVIVVSPASPEPARSTDEVVLKEAGVHMVRKGPSDWVEGKKLIVTNRRVIWRSGLLGKSETSIPLTKVTNVRISYSLSGRTLGYGTITIQASGGGDIVAEDVTDPEGMKSAILSQLG